MDLDDEVRAALRKDRKLPANAIQIAVKNGIVYVKGNVSPRDRKHALELVRRVESVAAVIDQTQVVGAET